MRVLSELQSKWTRFSVSKEHYSYPTTLSLIYYYINIKSTFREQTE